jgi:xanthine/CO dehydrogenase XdhC/CoxF family maturation factor
VATKTKPLKAFLDVTGSAVLVEIVELAGSTPRWSSFSV